MNRNIAVFDFDGTISRSDSFIKFSLHAVGIWRFLAGILLSAVPILKWKLGMTEGGVAKEKLFSRLFKGMDYATFCKYGQEFCDSLQRDCQATDGLNFLRKHITEGDEVFIISASMPEWIGPWAAFEGIDADHVIGTIPQRDPEGILTGNFLSSNCHGKEKVRRLKELIPGMEIAAAYGDSTGDRYLLQNAIRGIILHKGMLPNH